MKPARILVPVDFSEHSELALRYAGAWALRGQAELTALTVERFDAPPYLAPELMLDIHQRVAGERRAAVKYLKEFVERFLPKGVRRRCELRSGDPGAGILAAIRDLRASAVVMGTHGRSGLRALMMGSTTEEVAMSAPVPLLVVRALPGRTVGPLTAKERLGFQRVVVPDDGTQETKILVKAAASLLAPAGAEVFAVPVPDWVGGGAADQVLAEALRRRADLIVCHLALRNLFGGAAAPDPNTTDVMRLASCPVLVLPRADAPRRRK